MKSPAFQFYVNDFLGSAKVQMMTVEEVGAYTLLLCLDWQEVGFEYDEVKLARWCRMTPAKFRKAWVQLRPCFLECDGRLYSPRLQQERQKQERWRAKSSEGGKKSAERRHHQTDATPEATPKGGTKGGGKGGSEMVEAGRLNTPLPSLSSTPVTTTTISNARKSLVENIPEEYRGDVNALLDAQPDKSRLFSWIKLIEARLNGMHPPQVPAEILGKAIREFNANGETNWKRLEGYIRTETAGPPPRAGRRSRKSAAEQNWESGSKALEGVS